MTTSALIVIDAQKIYTTRGSELFCPDSKATIKRINSLIEHFAGSAIPVIFIRHTHKNDGSDLGRMFDYEGDPAEDFNFKEDSSEVEYDAHIKIPSNAVHIVKHRYSAFVGTNLESVLKTHRIDTLVICGFMTNFCCESTARDAHDRDYFVDFLVDATGTPGTENLDEEEVRRVVSDLLGAGFGRVHRTSNFLRRAAAARTV